MSKTGISFQMTAEHYDRIMQAINNLEAELGFVVGFSSGQRKKYQSIGDKTFAFVHKTMDYSTERADLMPPYSNLEEFRLDFDLMSKLRVVVEKIKPILQKITDSYLAVGDDTFTVARKFYGYIRSASVSGAPGADTIAKDLSTRFARTRYKVVPPVEETMKNVKE